ncbi:MAG: hypothetical protein GTN82_12820 [Candidatus Aminicenantes bacterium]|nr:hypothetical protein [Candidatus Aminicenantes bacterium]
MDLQNRGNQSGKTKKESISGFLEISNPYRPYDFASAKLPHHESVINEIKEKFANQAEKRVILLQGSPCAGKTTILKRIEDTPSLMGENYLPVYLDSSRYINRDASDLMYSVSKDIIDKLNNLGYSIPIPVEIKKRQIDHTTFESFILRLDIYLESDKVLLLMFDEFDRLLENISTQIIAEYIEVSRHIERSWNNYGLILAGDKKLLNLTNSPVINGFLENAKKIDLLGIHEEDAIETLIKAPVKHQLTYDKEAIDRIKWYSGGNIYFQQLICYYIVNFLNKKIKAGIASEDMKNVIEQVLMCNCRGEDVEQVVQLILDEKIPEFSYVWEKKLTIESRLIASALADKNTIEKRDSQYFLKENKLLESIFGNRLYKEIEELQDFGYINRMQRRYFRDCPFKIPLYGKWVQKEHPFLKTLIEHIETIADKIDLGVLVKKLEEMPGNRLVPFEKETILEIARKWCILSDRIIKQRNVADTRQVIDFIESLSRISGLTIKEKPQPNKNDFIIEVTNLKIGPLKKALCFIQNKPELKSDDIFSIEKKAGEFALQAQTNLTLFFHLRKNELIEELVKKPYLSLISIDENDLKKIILSENPNESLRRIILSKLSLNKISPFETAGPTTTIFYGRTDAINRIVSLTNKSFAVVGARKIGKTSLLLKLKDNYPPNTVYIFMSLESIFPHEKEEKTGKYNAFYKRMSFGKSPEKLFVKTFLYELERIFLKRSRFLRFGSNIDLLPKIVQKISQHGQEKGKKIVFIFDEIDGLIRFDKKNGYKMMRTFRTMSQNSLCQFVFAGFKELYYFKRDINHPLYNFCEEVKLEPLDKESALDLITKPMASLGIHYQNKGDRDIIMENTGSHPNLLQFYCQKLIEKIDKHQKVEDRRTIFYEDINQLFDVSYEDYIMDDVYMFSSDLSQIDKLILILLAEDYPEGNEEIFSIKDIKQKLHINDITVVSTEEIRRILKNLVMRFILLDKGEDHYKFALPVFPKILNKRIDDDVKQEIIMEINANAC